MWWVSSEGFWTWDLKTKLKKIFFLFDDGEKSKRVKTVSKEKFSSSF